MRRWFSNLESRKSPDGKEHWLTWIVQHKGQNAGIGYVQATIVGSEADIAWLIGTHWQGRGYAKEAVALLMSRLTEYPLTRLTAHIHPEHIASQQVATGLGLTRTDDIHAGEEVWAVSLTTPCAS